jgi:tetratricopeptide (TPR) repeat protein
LAQEIGRFDLALAGLFSLGLMAMRQGNPQKAVALVEPNLGMWDALHDRVELGHAYNLLARAVMMQGDYDRALTLIDQGEAIFCETGFDGSNYIALSRGDAAYALGRVAAARTFYERALELSKDDFDPMVVTLSQQGIARCAIRQNDLAAAQGAIERSRQVCEAMHEGWARVLIEFTAAELAWLSSHQALAEEHLRTGLQQVLPLGDCNAMAEGLELWAALLASTARPAQAVRLLGAADALRREIGAPVMPIDKERIQAAIAESRSALGAEAFAAAWEFGETQAQAGLQQVIELALNKS